MNVCPEIVQRPPDGRLNRRAAALTLVILLVMKMYYRKASADDLDWILAPTARLAAWFSHLDPVRETGVGYVDFSRGMIIAPACSGMNFLIMAFGLAAFCVLLRMGHRYRVWPGLILCWGLAYLFTLAVNTVRIIVSATLYEAGIRWAWLPPDRLHLLAGTCIYLGALGLFFKGLHPIISCYCRCFDREGLPSRSHPPAWLPLVWYLAGVIGVPAVNLLSRTPMQGFGRYCLTIFAAVAMIRAVGWGFGKLASHRWTPRR
jgi:exosortase K